MSPLDLLNRFLLALCIWREARGESYRGKMLVGSVIRNRLEDRRWPNTYAGVVTQPKQFSCFNAGDPNAVLFPKESDQTWVDAVMAANAVMDDDVITTANHYHTTGIPKPIWADTSKAVDTEGHHVFYRL